MTSKKKNSGMTLIEVMIALSIFTTSFFVLIDSQNLTIRNSVFGKKISMAAILAQDKLAEFILEQKGKPLNEIPESEKGKFEKPFDKFRWEQSSRDFEYDLSFLVDMAQGPQGEGQPPSPLLQHLPKISKFINKATKEITITVFWKDGTYERKFSITTHLFNFKEKIAI